VVHFCRKLICLKKAAQPSEEPSFEGRGKSRSQGTSGSLMLIIGDTILVVKVLLAASTYVAVGDKMLA